MIRLTLHEDLDLSKKSAGSIPKLLTSAHKEERMQTCEEFWQWFAATQWHCWTLS
jgi:hypothetical protein